MLKIKQIYCENSFLCIYIFFWVSAGGKYREKDLPSSRNVASVNNTLLTEKCRSI